LLLWHIRNSIQGVTLLLLLPELLLAKLSNEIDVCQLLIMMHLLIWRGRFCPGGDLWGRAPIRTAPH
jgi:hypothetical protein